MYVRFKSHDNGHFYCSFVANLFLCAKNNRGTMQFDKVIAKIGRVQLFCLTV